MVYAKLDEGAKSPTRKHPNDAGVDVYALEEVIIPPFTMMAIHTGVTIEVPQGYALLVFPKSGGNHITGAGVIDAGYQGEIMVKLLNYRPDPLVIPRHAPLAQLVMVPVVTGTVEEVGIADIHQQVSARGATGGILH